MSRLSWVMTGLVVIAAAAAALAVAGATAEKGEEKIPVKKLPKNVVAIVKVVCPGGRILSAEREVGTEGGRAKVEYDVKVKQQDGKIVEVEVELDVAGNIRKVQVGEDDDDDDDNDEEDDD